MPRHQILPINALGCHYVEQHELLRGLETHSRFCEFYEPANYFYITARPDSYTIEGWLGRPDYQPAYLEKEVSSLSFFQDYAARMPVCFTFDRITLYKVVDIIPEKPLKFILEQVRDFTNLISMISQEEIYQLVKKKQWDSILHILYKNKTSIAEDTLLQQSARIFEAEFVNDIVNHPLDDRAFLDQIGKLYMLHGGRFIALQPSNHRVLTIELAKRKQDAEALNYAHEYPDEPEAIAVIEKYKIYRSPSEKPMATKLLTKEWIEVYNRLFELINVQENSATYFSGPRFITAVKEFIPYFPDYQQYMTLRNENGKSTTRKIYYYDILMEQSEDIRFQIIQRILLQVSQYEPVKSLAIEMLLGLQSVKSAVIKKTSFYSIPEGTPVVFISYSWDDKEHSAWVLRIADMLSANGVEVILDQYDLKPGKHLTHFMEQAIRRASKILVIFTPNYKLKADDRTGGVGYEYSIMNMGLYNDQTGNDKIIPVLRRGSMEESIPEFMQQFIHIDLRNDANFENSFNDLLREIYNEPAINKPKLGRKPTFD